MQFDLFEHSRDVALRNDVVTALRVRNSDAATMAIARLAAEYPDDGWLDALATLLSGLRPLAPPVDHNSLEDHLRALDTTLVPAAAMVFGKQADEWLLTIWRQVATVASTLDFNPRHARAHAAEFYLRGGDVAGAAVAVARIASWRRQPVPLAWMAEAVCRDTLPERGFPAAWPLLAELAWIAPTGFAVLAERLAAPTLTALRRRFGREFDSDEDIVDAWFPAWACLEDTALAEGLKRAQWPTDTGPVRAARCIVGLFALERQGRHRELIAARAELRAAHAGLFALYMRTR